MVDQSSSNGFLAPTAQPQPQANRLLPSPIPPPTASSLSSHSPSQRPQSGLSANTHTSSTERYRDDISDSANVRKSHSHSISSNPHTLASSKGSTAAENREKQRAVRTLPRE